MNKNFYNCYFILVWTFTEVVKKGGIIAGRLFIWRYSEFVIISGVCKYLKEMDFFFLMLNSVKKFNTELFFFLEFV